MTYILSKFVTVKLVTGREGTAEVILKDHERDVALLKFETKGMVPLPVNSRSLKIGDDIYVLGSPLKKDLDVTLSKGVVSSFRFEEGLNLIQSDVNVLPGSSGGPLVDQWGNVSAITAKGYSIGNSPTGLNFFIPILEALDNLNIKIIE